MRKNSRIPLVLRAAIVIFAVAYIYFLSALFHGRDMWFPDQAFNFDSWWYLIHRLRLGEWPQWNPYSLLGRISLQWNFIPVSLFTPLLLLKEFDLESFRDCSVLQTLLTIFSYVFLLRHLGFGWLTVIFSVLLSVSSYTWQSAASLLPYLTYMIMTPFAFAAICKPILEGRAPDRKQFQLFALFLSLAMIGTRVDILLYGYTLFGLLLLLIGCELRSPKEKQIRYWLWVAAAFGISMAATSWQFPYILTSSLDNPRFSGGLKSQLLMDPLLWRHVLERMIVYVPTGIGILSWWIGRHRQHERLSMLGSGIVGLHVAYHFQSLTKIGVNPWLFGVGVVLFFVLVAAGAVSLGRKKFGAAILLSVVIFLWIGDLGVFFLHEGLGIPWLPERASVFLIPWVLLILAEGIQAIALPLRVHSWSWFGLPARVGVGVVGVLGMGPSMIPVKDGSTVQVGIFRATPIPEVVTNAFSRRPYVNTPLGDAWENTQIILKRKDKPGPLQRLSVTRSVGEFGKDDPKLNIIPSMLGVPNDAAKYSSDISSLMAAMFNDHFNGELPFHPEYRGTAFERYKLQEIARRAKPPDMDYGRTIVIHPYHFNPEFTAELLAVEGSRTKRAFFDDRLKYFGTMEEERRFLRASTKNGNALAAMGVVSSDPRIKVHSLHADEGLSNAEVAFLKDEPEEVELQVRTEKSGFLTLLDLYSPGWSATVDGRETDIYRVFIGTRAVFVPAGNSVIRFSYQVPGLMVGLIVSCFAWIYLLVVAGRWAKIAKFPAKS